jgi:RNA polymerase sigma-70 factor (ECF subfamily)
VNHRSEQKSDLLPDLDELAAFSELVRMHQAGLRGFIRGLGIDADYVDDIAQEVFVIAYRKRGDFEEGKDFGRWLRGIARNLVANERRKTARHLRLLDQAADDGALRQTAEPVDCEEIVAALNDCVAQLPEHSRALLLRRYQTGENASILAGTFRQTAESIRQTLSRIRQTVRQCVEAKIGSAW